MQYIYTMKGLGKVHPPDTVVLKDIWLSFLPGAKIGVLGPNVLATHMVHPTAEELLLLKKHDVGVSHNPQSNMKLASGIAPVPKMLELKIAVGLGSDGPASNNDLDLWEEIDTAAKLHKVASGDPTAVSAREAFAMATIDGAKLPTTVSIGIAVASPAEPISIEVLLTRADEALYRAKRAGRDRVVSALALAG